ncbi:14682_t:CDS:1 [Dentiscutata erythropus]|uniref:14682_t:CDS:1 n=1 Tax=Dentiscutata erythropus TaxID=1348616 RepID=A0A9N9CID1_9GLOM|nr:14682_t:CDS:1 [Dentiscutata erythropus]
MDDNYPTSFHYEQSDFGSPSYNTSIPSLFAKPPFIPTINIESLVSEPNRDHPYNAFKIYCKELRSRGITLNNIISLFWIHEQPTVKLVYANLANTANRLYTEKWPHLIRYRYQQLPVNQSLPSADTTRTISTHSINNSASSTPAIETRDLHYESNTNPYQEIVNPLDICNQIDLTPPNEDLNKRPASKTNRINKRPTSKINRINKRLTSKTNRTNTSAACNLCKKSKVRCKYSDNGPCERCVKKEHECKFSPQQKRGPQKSRSDINNCAVVQKLDKYYKDFMQKVNKHGYCVDNVVIRPGTSNQVDALQILTSPIEEFTAYTSVNYESGISNNSSILSPGDSI